MKEKEEGEEEGEGVGGGGGGRGAFWRQLISRDFCMTISSGTLVIYNTEVFPTKVRTLAVGFVSAVTRIGSVISPYVFYFLYGIDIQYVFYCFVVLISLNGVLTLFLPMDTRGMALDNMEELRRRKEEEDLFGRRRG